MINKFGVQTFTVRKHIQTPSDLKNTLIKLYEMGYSNFELARIKFDEANLKVLKELKKEYNITYSTSQIKYSLIQKDFDFLMKFSNELEIKYIEVAVIPMKSFFGKKSGMKALAKDLDELGKRTKEHGVNLLFHHHNFELIKMEDKLGIEHLIDNTNSEYVNFVADTYWLASSGFDPYTFINKYITRIKGIHLRDSKLVSTVLFFKCSDDVVGEGSVDFSKIVNLDVEFFSVEQDSQEPFTDLNKSLEHLNKLSMK